MIRRVAYLSMHTSPLVQPGSGNAGGMNVYIDQLARAMVEAGVAVEVFTRRDRSGLPDRVTVVPGYTVHHIDAGPTLELSPDDMAVHVRRFARGVITELESLPPVDVVHTHYWLSGWAGVLVKQELGLPMANSFHTLGRVKDLYRPGHEAPESLLRIAAEAEVIAQSDCVVASTPLEADDLLAHYGANPGALCVAPPGVDHSRFFPASQEDARRRLGLEEGPIIGFVGRVQALKGVDVALEAYEQVLDIRPDTSLVIVGGPSGPRGHRMMKHLKSRGRDSRGEVRFFDPLPHRTLADVYRALDVLHVPSRSESFGLVAVEAQACGTPVVASRVGGLIYAVDDGVSGVLVDGWEPADHADALMSVIDDPARAALMSKQAVEWAERFAWENTVSRFMELYSGLVGVRG